MNYQEALEKLEKLYNGFRNPGSFSDEFYLLYGELEEIITRFAGRNEVVVPNPDPRGHNIGYPNYIEACLMTDRGWYRSEGYTQLLKIIGKVRQHAKDPSVPQVEYSVTNLVRILQRFRECCQHLKSPLEGEPAVQDMLWIMLRSHFDRLDREETLSKFGVKSYRPDFGIPDLRILIEVKFIGPKTDVPSIQEGILADIPGYLNDSTQYDSVIAFVYDAAHKLRDSRKFIEDLKSVEGIIDVIVVPGIT